VEFGQAAVLISCFCLSTTSLESTSISSENKTGQRKWYKRLKRFTHKQLEPHLESLWQNNLWILPLVKIEGKKHLLILKLLLWLLFISKTLL